jgi:hypothetical protein
MQKKFYKRELYMRNETEPKDSRHQTVDSSQQRKVRRQHRRGGGRGEGGGGLLNSTLQHDTLMSIIFAH